METFDRQIILRKIGEVEQQIARRRKQQENSEEILESLKERLAPDEYKTTLKHPAEVSLTTILREQTNLARRLCSLVTH